VLLAGLDDDLRVAQLLDLLRQQRAQLLANLRRDAARAAVGDDALLVQRAEVRARRHIAGLQLHPEAKRLDDATADLELQRVIAEQPEMAGAAAGRDAGRDGDHAALRAAGLHERVEVRRGGGFERRHVAGGGGGDVAEAVEHDEGELRARLDGERGVEFVEFHGPVSVQKTAFRRRVGQTAGIGFPWPKRRVHSAGNAKRASTVLPVAVNRDQPLIEPPTAAWQGFIAPPPAACRRRVRGESWATAE
jgi:hypothetical protein